MYQKKPINLYLLLTIFFIFSRLILLWCGVHATTYRIESNQIWGYLPLDLVLNKPWDVLIYNHMKPPGPYLLIAAIHFIFGKYYLWMYAGLLKVLGWLGVMCIFYLLKAMGVSQRWSFVAALIVIIHPAFILYENTVHRFFTSYDFIVSVALLGGAVLFHKMVEEFTFKKCLGFFLVLAFICLYRSLFHLIWILFWVGYLMWWQKNCRKAVLLAAIGPLLVVVAFYFKNYQLIGNFGISSWAGISLARIASFHLPDEIKDKEIAKGNLSPIVKYHPFSKQAKQIIEENSERTYRNEVEKFLIDFELSKTCLKDSLFALRHYPSVYVKNLPVSFSLFVFPPSQSVMLPKELVDKIRSYNNWFCLLRYGYPLNLKRSSSAGVEIEASSNRISHYYKLLLRGRELNYLLFVIIFCHVLILLKRFFNRNTTVLVFVVFNIFYAVVLCTLIELGENNRYAYTVEPLLTIMVVYYLYRVFQWIKKRRNLNKLCLQDNQMN